jgi:hypothetical protein
VGAGGGPEGRRGTMRSGCLTTTRCGPPVQTLARPPPPTPSRARPSRRPPERAHTPASNAPPAARLRPIEASRRPLLSAVRAAHSNPRPPAAARPLARAPLRCGRPFKPSPARRRPPPSRARPSPACERAHAREQCAARRPLACTQISPLRSCVFECAVKSAPSYSEYFLLGLLLTRTTSYSSTSDS